MKNFKISTIAIIAMCLVLVVGFTSCENKGVVTERLNGDEQSLPEELKGLKIYSVSIGSGNYVKVAVLNGNVNSTTYQVGRFQETTIIVNKQDGKSIEVSQILIENDSIIVCRK